MTRTPKLTIETPRWAKPLLVDYARYRGAYGGRASGKSWFFAGAMIERHYIKQPTFSVCIREVQKDLKHSAKRLLEIQIEKFNLGKHFTVQENQIRTPGNGLIIFQGMQSHNSESIKSLESYDIAWAEEARNLSQRSLDLLRPTIRKDGSEIWFTWNPYLPTDPVDQFLRGEQLPPNSVVVEANFSDNPWLPQAAKDEIAFDRRRDPDKFKHVWQGGYVTRSDAKVFKNWQIDEFDAPSDAIFRLGLDFGFSIDPTACVRCFVVGKKLFIDWEAYQIGCEIMDLPDLLMTIPQAERWPMSADSSRPETISHLRNHGFPKIYGAVKGKDSVYEGIEWLKSYDIIVHPRCKHTIDELTLYSYKTDQKTEEVLPILSDKSNHCIDSIRYALESLRRAEKQKKPIGNAAPISSAMPISKKRF